MNEITHIKREIRSFSNWGYIKLDVFEIHTNDLKCFNSEFNYIFELLKMKGFNNSVEELAIDYDSFSEIEYGNFNLKMIRTTSFIKLELSASLDSIKKYICFIDKLITGSLKAAPVYNQYFEEIFLPHINSCKEAFELKTDHEAKSALTLSWGGRYEHFKSFIFLCPNSKTVKHLEMGRD